jgi:biotin-dependent carboxylase uncharacterized domain
MGLRILNAGALSSIQDKGRYGFMAAGFSPSGAMDERALCIANLLVGNGRGEAAIETTLFGITAEFDTPAVIALTGADMSPELNGAKIENYRAVKIEKGDTLTLSAAASGCRGYLAVAGGFYLKKVMGSLSTNMKVGVGGYLGRKLKAGDVLFFNTVEPEIKNIGKRALPVETVQVPATVRAVLGPQNDYFTENGIETFFNSEYKLTADSDRMGIKLEGPAVESLKGVDIISDGIPLGGVQIPSSGKPIVMAADRQTTGGYAKIATVVSTDMGILAQLKPGDTVKFKQVSLEEAVRIYKQNNKFMRRLERKWKR